MTTAQIIERAKFSPQFKADKYKSTNNNIHYEKVVVRNLLKEIPKISENLKSIVAFDEVGDYTDYIEVGGEHQEQIEAQKINKLDEAKKEMAKEKPKPEPEKAEKEETAKGSATEASEFF
jgi:hypothetical protein